MSKAADYQKEVYILSAVRTPIGSFNGYYHRISAKSIGAMSLSEAVKRARVDAADLDEVIIGQVLASGQGQNVARQTAVGAEIPLSVPAYTLNMVCGSGLKAVYNAYVSIVAGEADLIACGGQENMSRAEHTGLIRDAKIANFELKDSILSDGLTCAFEKIHMGETAESLARRFDKSRKRQDEVAAESQMRAEAAIKAGFFEREILPVMTEKSIEPVTRDEYPRFGTTVDKLLNLKPCFMKKDVQSLPGTVTPGNATGLNDGAASLVLCSGTYARKKRLTPMAKVIGFAQVAIEPMNMGLAPIPTVTKLLEKVGWTKEQVDLYEINESFAVQFDVVVEQLQLPPEKVNISGGSVALGHPLGASGARILVTLVHNLRRLNLTKGVAALCIGGGMGLAIAIEAYPAVGEQSYYTPVSRSLTW